MPDSRYCYPDTDILINKLNIKDEMNLFKAEERLTSIRLQELQNIPIKGNFDFEHLKQIHWYIFQDIYEWAGRTRTVDIGKGNLFCTVACINDYAESVFNKYYMQCYSNKDDIGQFIEVLASNYGDLNALHPFREGNGRAQREFARELCLSCGFDFDLSCSTHKEMLEASVYSFNTGDSSKLNAIFKKAVTPYNEIIQDNNMKLKILSVDDLLLGLGDDNYYYEYVEYSDMEKYNEVYKEKIKQMDLEKYSVKK